MICVATFDSYVTFNLKVYNTNTYANLDEFDFCEFEVKRYNKIPSFMLLNRGFKTYYKRVSSNKDFSRILTLRELEIIVGKLRVLDIADNYNYRFVLSYVDGKFKIISRSQIKNMYYVPSKKTAYYLNTLFLKIPLTLKDDLSNNLMYSIIATNANKCACSMNLCLEPLLEHNPSGVYLNVANISGFKNRIKLLCYLKADIFKAVKILLYKSVGKIPKKYRHTTGDALLDEEDISYLPSRYEYKISELLKETDSKNIMDILNLLISEDAIDIYIKEYQDILSLSYNMMWDGIISDIADIKYIDVYDVFSGIRREKYRDEIKEKIKQNKRAEKISKNVLAPKLFDVFGNVLIK